MHRWWAGDRDGAGENLVRFLCAALCAAFLPVATLAADSPENPRWRVCGTSADCVLIDGVCSKTAVNIGYRDSAVSYYQTMARDAKCVTRFWVPQDVVAECREKAGPPELRSKTCDVVAKPKSPSK